ncbi:MAG: L-2-hydroxyglutarate oxidase [Gemmatimonadales bacterium]
MASADVAVIGGGIVGLASALALVERHGKSVVVLEAERSVAAHQTGHNSGVIHSGLYYQPGSLKATLCRAGLDAMYRFCAEEGVPFRRCGKLVVAVTDDELARLDRLEALGRGNGVTIRRVPGPALTDYEPHVVGRAGLWVEETGVVAYRMVAEAIRRRLERQGGEVRLGARVRAIRRDGSGFALETEAGLVASRALVSCAGLQADRIARLAGAVPEARIVAFRGEYYRLRAERANLVRGLIYPVADPALPFLGVHFTRGVDDAVEAGPNAVLATSREGYRWRDVSVRDLAEWIGYPGFWRLGIRHWRTGLDEALRSLSRDRFAASLARLVPEVRADDLAPGGTGVRAQAVDRDGRLVYDFVFADQPNAVHVLNAPSPAATASLAIGEAVAARLVERL